jgi:hypothetical protein
VTYKNTPHPDIDAALTLEDAAKLAGYSPNGFRTIMSRLNKAGHDLRAPARPGERARRYDADKLAAWIEGGKIIPARVTTPAPTEGGRIIQATATHSKETWTATLDTGGTVVAKNLHTLQVNAAALAAQKLDVPADQVSVQLNITPPADIGERWAETVKEKQRGQEIISAAVEARHGIVADLKAANFTNDDIAAMLGISPQRVQQHSKGA